MTDEILNKLDLSEYINTLNSLFSRPKNIAMQGDRNVHFACIDELSKHLFDPPKNVANLDDALIRLSKQAVLGIFEISEFANIIKYFLYLKSLKFQGKLGEWLNKIDIRDDMRDMALGFDDDGLKDSVDIRFGEIKQALSMKKKQIDIELRKLIYAKHVSSYLVDTQVHYIQDSETLLVRGGFNHVLKGVVVARSSGGYFYVMPSVIEKLKKEQSELLDKKELVTYEHAKRLSGIMNKSLPFLKFLNTAYDIFDSYQARVRLARSRDYEFVLPDNSHEIKLVGFAHPALKNPKLVNIDFSKKVLLITGVNAGGKSMLLKSIITAAMLSKYMLPMQINANKSKIGSFKEFDAIIEDPQNVKNDISTFAGRMLSFSKLFSKRSLVIGVDEIELGTDFEEAASLYSVLINRLSQNDIKMIITTHHKRLAMLLSKNQDVELVAALYDEVAQRPKYEFLKGTIGKSYAFETAQRYGIHANIVNEAKIAYGLDKQNLNEMITKTLNLESELKYKLDQTIKKEAKLDDLIQSLKDQKQTAEKKINETILVLEREYLDAINKAKAAVNLKDTKDKQRAINAANQAKKEIKKPESSKSEILNVGDRVKYGNVKGVVLSLNKTEAMIESEGIKMRVPLNSLSKNGNPVQMQKAQVSLKVQRPQNASVTLDLHGLRSDEAIDRLDKFISDSLVMGFEEVMVYHGIGTGRLAWAVKNFLKTHPSVKDFCDAPPNQGGFGAKIVRF